MAGTSEGGKKAAETIEKKQPGFHSEIGEKGGQASSGRQAMETRAENQGKDVHEVASEMGSKGGQHSQGGNQGRQDKEDR
jgi:general stress protein YciG